LIATGGEPLASFGKLLELIALARAKHAEVGLFSNLSLLTASRARELKSAGVSWYRTTLNGPTAAVHEQTYPPGSFAQTLRGIESAALAGSTVKLRATVCRNNFGQIEEMVRFAIALGVKELDFRPYLPLGDCNPHGTFALSPYELIEAAALLLRLQSSCKAKVQLKLLPNWFDFIYRGLLAGQAFACELCHCGRSYLYIDAAGNYRACAGHRAAAGSIFTSPIDEIWRTSAFLEEARTYKQEAYCVACAVREACHASNCHLINYEAAGRFDAVNPTCPVYAISPKDWAAGYEQVRSVFLAAYSRTERPESGGQPS
jgi:radical SAM protein with 4Fe4S-binding SPASM domain